MDDQHLTRAELWARFAAAAYTSNFSRDGEAVSAGRAAVGADRMLAEFELRWTWDGQDEVWKRRPEAK